ncbi:MAG: hypothetical protein ACKOFW_03865 [Planctomycetaceae bacterium]
MDPEKSLRGPGPEPELFQLNRKSLIMMMAVEQARTHLAGLVNHTLQEHSDQIRRPEWDHQIEKVGTTEFVGRRWRTQHKDSHTLAFAVVNQFNPDEILARLVHPFPVQERGITHDCAGDVASRPLPQLIMPSFKTLNFMDLEGLCIAWR